MQSDEQLLECIVAFMDVYCSSLPGKVSHQRRVSTNLMRGCNRVIGPRPLDARRHTRERIRGYGERGPNKNDRLPPLSGRRIRTLEYPRWARTVLRQEMTRE